MKVLKIRSKNIILKIIKVIPKIKIVRKNFSTNFNIKNFLLLKANNFNYITRISIMIIRK